LRPGLQALLLLKNKYDLGIYSSATEKTVRFAMKKIDGSLAGENKELKHDSRSIFDVILHRKHCELASDLGISRADGKPWDTVKPLAKYFEDLTKVALIDDSSHKSIPGEEKQMVVIPSWDDDQSKPNDTALQTLVDCLLSDSKPSLPFQEIVELTRRELMHPSEQYKEDVQTSSIEELEVFEDRGRAEKNPPLTDAPCSVTPVSDHPVDKIQRNKYTALHRELEMFARLASPSQDELDAIQDVVTRIDVITQKLWPKARAMIFGSQASGLALPGADVDIAIIGIGPNMKSASSGYNTVEKGKVKSLLLNLVSQLLKADLVKGDAEIINARIPIVKFNARTQRPNHFIPIDISIGTKNGITAVDFLRRNIKEIPPLRPIALFVKALLREKCLNEVFTGGLGSYAILNIIIAYLQSKHGYKVAMDVDDSSTKGIRKYWKKIKKKIINTLSVKEPFSLNNEATIEFIRGLGQRSISAEASLDTDLGILLWDFLDYFGSKFNYYKDALSVLQGGVVEKGRWRQPKKPWLLAVEDPQDPGREICGGSFQIQEIKGEFARLAAALAEACEVDKIVEIDTFGPSQDLRRSLLSSIIDIDAALGRDYKACRSRELIERQKRERQPASKGKNLTRVSKATIGSHLKGSKKGKNALNKGIKKKKQPQKEKGTRRGSKGARAVEAQWRNSKGQHFQYVPLWFLNPKICELENII
jgi:non-canonical poly(A) RNA polymerase PAPD5/7